MAFCRSGRSAGGNLEPDLPSLTSLRENPLKGGADLPIGLGRPRGFWWEARIHAGEDRFSAPGKSLT